MRSRIARVLFFVPLAIGVAAASPLPARADAGLGEYIVTFAAPPTPDQIDMLSGVAQSAYGYANLPAADVLVAPGDEDILRNMPDVVGVYPNSSLRPLLAQSTHTLRADAAWSLGYTGAGIGVAVIDTGIDGTHPDLCARIEFCHGTGIKTIQNVKFIGMQDMGVPVITALEDQINTDTSSGHGTHVSGIVASFGTASVTPNKYRGVAHGASLIGLGTGELLNVSNVLAAFDWVLAHRNDPRYNIKVINASWGPSFGTPYDPNDPVNRAVVVAHDAGITTVFAAGNDGPRTDALNMFSVNPAAISVAGGTKQGHIAFFSSRGIPGSAMWHPTVTAPGYQIASDRASTGFAGDVADVTGGPNPDMVDAADTGYYATASGTSMAAPHIAGVVALMQQASWQNRHRYLTPDQVKNILQNTAVSRDAARGPGGLPNYQQYTMGAGYADALTAVNAAAANTQMGTYNPHVRYNVRTFGGSTDPTTSFNSTISVASGAISLDVMADWAQAANDVDIDLFNPLGVLVKSTTLLCDPSAEPNGYSSFCTQTPNERLTVVAPMAGTWRVNVHMFAGATETVRGTWSVAVADTVPVTPPAPASVTVAPASTTSATGQSVALTATVRDASGNPIPNTTVSWSSSGVGYLTLTETTTHADGTARATATSSVPGNQTVTARAATVSGSAAITWTGVVIPGTGSTPGRAHGGGWFNDPTKHTFAFWAEYRSDWSRPYGMLCYDDHAGNKIKSHTVDRIVLDGKVATITGPAEVNGAPGYHYTLTVGDNDDDGNTARDSFDIKLTKDLDLLYAYHSGGTIGGGNIEVEPL